MRLATRHPVVVTQASAAEARRRPDNVLAAALAVLGVGLALNAVLGPLVLDVVDYALSTSVRNQALGLEAFSLAVVAPACVAVAVLVRRRATVGAVAAVPLAGYAAYMLVQYVVGPGYERYAGIVPFHLALFVVSGIVAVRAWAAVDVGRLPPATTAQRRRQAAVLIGLAAFVVVRYSPMAAVGDPLPAEFAEEPGFFWSIVLLDLGVTVPLALWTAARVRRAAPNAAKAVYAVVGWFALVPPSVAAMAVVMAANDDPNGSWAAVVLFGAAALAFGAYAVALYRPLLKRQGGRLPGTAAPTLRSAAMPVRSSRPASASGR